MGSYVSLALRRAYRTRAGVAALAGMGAVVLPVGYLRTALRFDAIYDRPIGPDLLFAGLLAGALAMVGVWQTLAARHERARAQQRTAGLAGNLNTMPRARPTSDLFDSEGQPGVPVVEWRAHWQERYFLGPLLLLFFGLGAIAIGILLAEIVVMLAEQNLAGLGALTDARDNSAQGQGSSLAMLAGVLVAVLPVSWVFIRRSWSALFRHFTIEADDAGLRWRGSWGRERLIRWEEARLFEVHAVRLLDIIPGAGGSRRVNRYRLYAADQVITWDNDRDFLSRQARQRLSHLLFTIGQRSGLALRTPDQPIGLRSRLRALRWRELRLGAIGVFWALYSLALLVVVALVPPTTVVALNVLIGASLLGSAALAGWSLEYYWRTALALRQRTQDELAARHGGRRRRVPFPALPAVVAAQRMQAARGQRYLWLYRVAAGIWMISLAADALPVLAVIWFAGAWPWSHTQLVPAGITRTVAFLLIGHGIVGIIGLAVAVALLVVVVLRRRNRLAPLAGRIEGYPDKGDR